MAFAETSIKSEVDKLKINSAETLTYKLTISSSEKQIPKATIPKFNGFKVISQAQSSNMSFTKGKITTGLVYVFILAPTNIGKFKIEPSTIKVKGQAFSSDAFEIEVTQGQAQPRSKPSLPENLKPETKTGQPQYTL